MYPKLTHFLSHIAYRSYRYSGTDQSRLALDVWSLPYRRLLVFRHDALESSGRLLPLAYPLHWHLYLLGRSLHHRRHRHRNCHVHHHAERLHFCRGAQHQWRAGHQDVRVHVDRRWLINYRLVDSDQSLLLLCQQERRQEGKEDWKQEGLEDRDSWCC